MTWQLTLIQGCERQSSTDALDRGFLTRRLRMNWRASSLVLQKLSPSKSKRMADTLDSVSCFESPRNGEQPLNLRKKQLAIQPDLDTTTKLRAEPRSWLLARTMDSGRVIRSAAGGRTGRKRARQAKMSALCFHGLLISSDILCL